MAGESSEDNEDVDSNLSSTVSETEMNKTKKKKKKKKKGVFLRIWNAIFRSHGDDFEKRLQHISKEEAAVLSRIRKRSQNWRRITRHFILLSVLLEVIAVGYAIMATRTPDLNWKMRALRVLPTFLLPGLSFLTYSTLRSLNRMFDRKDQKTVERLRAERQAKIDELKEKTNYYITQQLIQRYDSDPAAKAAAATVLASKLGADSGLKVYVGDESESTTPTGKSSDVQIVPSNGLRNRKQALNRASSADSTTVLHPHEEEMLQQGGFGAAGISQHQQLVVAHHDPTSFSANDGGWLARIAALLVGEDPTQSYALICGNCHMHNGLARKEDFPFITYYCPHCKALNQPKQLGEQVSESNSPHTSSSTTLSDVDMTTNARGSMVEATSGSTNPVVAAAAGTTEAEKIHSGTGSFVAAAARTTEAEKIHSGTGS